VILARVVRSDDPIRAAVQVNIADPREGPSESIEGIAGADVIQHGSVATGEEPDCAYMTEALDILRGRDVRDEEVGRAVSICITDRGDPDTEEARITNLEVAVLLIGACRGTGEEKKREEHAC
jgi:hypothetical protein